MTDMDDWKYISPKVSNQDDVFLHALQSGIWGQMLIHIQKDSNILLRRVIIKGAVVSFKM